MEHFLEISNFEKSSGKGFAYQFNDGSNVVQMNLSRKRKSDLITFEVSTIVGKNSFQEWLIHDPTKNFSLPFRLNTNFEYTLDSFKPYLVNGTLHILAVSTVENQMAIGTALFNNPELSDVTIEVGKEKLRLHKCILFKHSTVFKAMLSSGMAESVSNTIQILDFKSKDVRACFELMYAGDNAIATAWNICPEVFRMACFYRIQSIIDRCELLYSQNLSKSNIFERLQLAISCQCSELKCNCIEFLKKDEKVDVQKIVELFGMEDGFDLIDAIKC